MAAELRSAACAAVSPARTIPATITTFHEWFFISAPSCPRHPCQRAAAPGVPRQAPNWRTERNARSGVAITKGARGRWRCRGRRNDQSIRALAGVTIRSSRGVWLGRADGAPISGERGGERGSGLRRRLAQPGPVPHRKRYGRRGPGAGDLRAGAPGGAPVHAGHESQGVAVSDLAQHVPEPVPAPAAQPDGGRSRHRRRRRPGLGERAVAARRHRARSTAQAGGRGDRDGADDPLGGGAHGDSPGPGGADRARGGRGGRLRGRHGEVAACPGASRTPAAAKGLRAMTCEDARAQLLDYQRGRLAFPAESEVRAHLDGCADCTRDDALEHELTKALEQRLPLHPASIALKRRLAAQWPTPSTQRSWWRRWRPVLMPALAFAALLMLVTPVLYYERTASRMVGERAGLVAEAVNDHLRVLASQHPLDIES